MTSEDTILSQLMIITEKVGGVLSGQATFSSRLDHIEKRIDEVFELHAKCSGPIAHKEVEDLRSEFEQHIDRTTTTKNKSEDKISRPPKPPMMSERTVQMLIVLCIIALGGAGLLVQLFGV